MLKLPMFKLSLIIVALGSVIGIGYAGLSIWRDCLKPEKFHTMQDNHTINEHENRDAGPMIDMLPASELDTSDWKTYHNEQFGRDKIPLFLVYILSGYQ
jgi:hypothetical protein